MRGPEFRNRSPRDFYSFVLENDLFIVFNPNKWNIDADQKDFLVQTIQSTYNDSYNIFLFCHELIWWASDNKFGNIEINYRPHYLGNSNFHTEIKPILETLSSEVVFSQAI